MKSIGIVVCNYNKADYVVNCIRSLFEQTVNDFDIYVVDNASTDDSVRAIKDNFGDKVNLIVNQENFGGSGGFNTGLSEALKQNYEFLMCVDNDVVFDKDNVKELRNFLRNNSEVGIVGSCAYFMDDPERVWSYGADIDFEKYVQHDNYRNCKDTSDLPDEVFCTYVPACAMMLRTEMVRKIGIMKQENFIYWDDIEWGYRFNKSGYKVAACKKAKVWHKVGGRNGGTTFNNYYIWRNRIRFFLEVLSGEEKEKFADVILSDMFRTIYSCNLKGDYGVVKSIMYAFNDAVNGISGKAEDFKIFARTQLCNRVENVLKHAENVVIKYNGDVEALGNIIRNIRGILPDIEITISFCEGKTSLEQLKNQFTDCSVSNNYEPDKFNQHLVICNHIFNINKDMPQDNYIDSWNNIISSKDDYIYASSFLQSKQLFILTHKELMLHSRK